MRSPCFSLWLCVVFVAAAADASASQPAAPPADNQAADPDAVKACGGIPRLPDADSALRRARELAGHFDRTTPDLVVWQKTMVARYRPLDSDLAARASEGGSNVALGVWDVGPQHPWSSDVEDKPAFAGGMLIAKCDGRLVTMVHYSAAMMPEPPNPPPPLDNDNN